MLERKIAKLQLRLGGIREMTRVPDLLIVVDAEREYTAVKEANILKIPVMALVDTNADPDMVDHILPANDDAMRSIRLLIGALADAVIEGHNLRQSAGIEEEEEETFTDAYDEELADEDLLGESTLAKLRDTKLFGEEETEARAKGEAGAAENGTPKRNREDASAPAKTRLSQITQEVRRRQTDGSNGKRGQGTARQNRRRSAGLQEGAGAAQRRYGRRRRILARKGAQGRHQAARQGPQRQRRRHRQLPAL